VLLHRFAHWNADDPGALGEKPPPPMGYRSALTC